MLTLLRYDWIRIRTMVDPNACQNLTGISPPGTARRDSRFTTAATTAVREIVPLSFLSGTFYTIDNLPATLQLVSRCNPFFYMIDGIRYSFLDKADGSIIVGIVYLSILGIALWFLSYLLYKKGYKIKS